MYRRERALTRMYARDRTYHYGEISQPGEGARSSLDGNILARLPEGMSKSQEESGVNFTFLRCWHNLILGSSNGPQPQKLQSKPGKKVINIKLTAADSVSCSYQ